jgi:hypothetical protein
VTLSIVLFTLGVVLLSVGIVSLVLLLVFGYALEIHLVRVDKTPKLTRLRKRS